MHAQAMMSTHPQARSMGGDALAPPAAAYL
jgi:hypothetical protein